MAMNQVLNLIDTRGVEEKHLEINHELVSPLKKTP